MTLLHCCRISGRLWVRPHDNLQLGWGQGRWFFDRAYFGGPEYRRIGYRWRTVAGWRASGL
jgi:hypothetical protein